MMMMVILAMHIDKGESSAAEEYGEGEEDDDDDGDDNDSCSSLVCAISQLALFLLLSLPLFLSLETFIHSVIHACPREQVFEGNWMKSGSTPPQTGKK